jgi:hypothetical protein
MISTDYAFRHIEAVIGLIVGRDDAFEQMDISADGFWRSFWAIVFSLPAFFFMWTVSSRDPAAYLSPIIRIGLDATFDIGIWLLTTMILILLLRPLGYENRTAHLIVARNWASLIITYISALIYIPEALSGPGSAGLIAGIFILLIVTIVMFVRLTRKALECGMFTAIGLVVGEFIFVIVIAMTLYPSAPAS